MQETYETQVQSLGQKDSLEEGMATHSTILAWRIPWAETQRSIGLQGGKWEGGREKDYGETGGNC